MAHTLSTLRARVRARAASNGADSLLTDTQLNLYVNQALQAVSLEADWPWQKVIDATQTVTVNNGTFTPPAGWYRSQSLTHVDTGEPLERRAPKYLDRVVGTGRPWCWAPDGVVISVRPVADGTYTLVHRYFKSEPTLTGDSSVPLIPEVYSQPVVEYAAYQALTQGNSVGRAAQAWSDYQTSLRRIKDNCNQGSDPLRITPRPGGHL